MQEDQTLYQSVEPKISPSQSQSNFFENSLNSFLSHLNSIPNLMSQRSDKGINTDRLFVIGFLSLCVLSYQYPIILSTAIHCVGVINPIIRTIYGLIDNNMQEQRLMLKWWTSYIITSTFFLILSPLLKWALPMNVLSNLFFIAFFIPPYQLSTEIFDHLITGLFKRNRQAILEAQQGIVGTFGQLMNDISNIITSGINTAWERMFGRSLNLHGFQSTKSNEPKKSYSQLNKNNNYELGNKEILEQKYDNSSESDVNDDNVQDDIKTSDNNNLSKKKQKTLSSENTNQYKKQKHHQQSTLQDQDEKVDVA